MPKLDQRGFIAQIFFLLILGIGLVAGIYLVQHRTNLFPKAFEASSGVGDIDKLTNQLLASVTHSSTNPLSSVLSEPKTTFSLITFKSKYALGDEIAVKLITHSDLQSSNLFSAKLNYDTSSLKLNKVDTSSSFVKNWVEQDYKTPGVISLTGGIPSSGLQTKPEDEQVMAVLYFSPLKKGSSSIVFSKDSAIYSNADNKNILSSSDNVAIEVSDTASNSVVQEQGMVNIAKQREELLKQLLRSNPQEFLKKATLVDKVSDFPDTVKPYLEQKVDDQGTVTVIHGDDFTNKKSTYDYYLGDKPDRSKPTPKYKYHLFFQSEQNLISGSQLQFSGIKLDQDAIVISSKVLTVPLAAAVPVIGDQKTLVVLVSLPGDTTSDPTFSLDYINSHIFGNGSPTTNTTLNSYYKDNSFNKISFSGDTVGPFSLDYNSPLWGFCDTYSWAWNADQRVTSSGINLADYKYKMYVFKTKPTYCSQGGAGTMGESPSMSWIFDRGINVFLHEVGHNLGNHHANFLNCGQSVVDAATKCQNIEYGDSTDVMGSTSMLAPQFNGPHKAAMGWINNVQTISSNGTYTISPLEATTTQPQILRISKPDTSEYYYISYRQKTGYDSGFADILVRGANIHVWNENSLIQTKLLDTNPSSTADITDASLSDGASFYDSINDIRIKQTGHTLSTGTTTGSVTLEINFSTTPQSTSRRVFITSQTFNGNLSGLSGADAKCQTVATGSIKYSDLKNSTWKAWISDRNTSVSSRLAHLGAFALLNGNLVAHDWTDLTDSSLLKPINIDENGNLVQNANVWTNSKPDGSIGDPFGDTCKDWFSADGYPFDLAGYARSGFGTAIDSSWTYANQGSDCSNKARLYCFEEPAPVQTPPVCNSCSADVNKNGKVDIADYSLVTSCFNKNSTDKLSNGVSCSSADINSNGKIEITDYSCVVSKFGQKCQ